VACDLASAASVTSSIGRIVEQGLDFDILVNCGGITHRGAPEDFPDELWNEVSINSRNSTLTEDSTSEPQCAVSII
jgi:NAD(P)-dependent dehydrogenase (short-subunit alcohol dehydrogenase family)